MKRIVIVLIVLGITGCAQQQPLPLGPSQFLAGVCANRDAIAQQVNAMGPSAAQIQTALNILCNPAPPTPTPAPATGK